jgi:hypothetical protein
MDREDMRAVLLKESVAEVVGAALVANIGLDTTNQAVREQARSYSDHTMCVVICELVVAGIASPTGLV